MLKIYIFCFLLFFYNKFLFAQSPANKDSISYFISTAKNDTSGVQKLYKASAAYLHLNIDSCMHYATKAMRIAEQIKYDTGYFIGLKFKGDALIALGQFEILYQLGQEALAYAEKINKPFYKGRAYFTMAMAKQFQYQILHSINLYSKALPYFEETNSKANLSRVYQNVANLLYEQKAFDKGMQYANTAYLLNIELGDTIKMLECHGLKGNLLYGARKFDQANATYTDVFKSKAFSLLNPANQLIVLINLGSLNYDMEKYDSSLYWFEMANVTKNKFQLELFNTQLLSKTANTQLKLGKTVKAYQLLNMAENNAGDNEDKTDLYGSWADYYMATGNYAEANKKLIQLREYTDSLITDEAASSFLQMDSLMAQSEKQRLLNQKELSIYSLQAKAVKKNRTITLLSISAVALLATGIIYYLFSKKKEQLKNKNIALLNKENQFIALKSSLEGQLQERSRISKEIHDELGSSLTSISLLAEVLKKRLDTTTNPEVNKISETSADMVDKMNEIIWALNTSNDTVSSLVAYLRKFANNFLQDANIELEFLENNIPNNKALEGTVRRNIYLSAKEALHNIVKHSSAKKVAVNVDASNGLVINIADDGKGIDINTINSFGNGLKNMKKRMEDIGGKFSIETNNGTQIKLSY